MDVWDEWYGSTLRRKYVQENDGSLAIIDESSRGASLTQLFKSVFLPQGYPESVSQDYLVYQLWDTVQAFASSITGTLAHQAVLQGMGVGDEKATVLGATITWLLKDGSGMLGRISFAWLQGTSLDCNAKRWRFFADILNDFAICLKILGPNYPGVFTGIICVAGVCQSIVGVAGGATRAALTQHQSRRNNMADVSAKDGSQETLVNLAALICSLILVPVVIGKHLLIWVLFVIFTFLHLFANYLAVRSVVMETINQSRLNILVREFLKTSQVLSVKEVNAQEPIIWKTKRKLTINLGSSLKDTCRSTESIEMLRSVYSQSPYLLSVDVSRNSVHIVLSQCASIEDQLKSCFQAELINFYTENSLTSCTPNPKLQSLTEAVKFGDVQEILYKSFSYTQEVFPSFITKLQDCNWKTQSTLLGPDEWRINWNHGFKTKKEF